MAVDFIFAARSDVGLIRKNNQDSAYAGPHLLVLADGMGGPAGGDIASSVVIAHLAPLDDASASPDELLPDLTGALQAAHDELVDRSANDPRLKGLGTTCTAILRSENKLAMAHIGDSRAYLLREGSFTQVTADHSFVQYLIDTGQISKEEAKTHPKRSVILRVVGDSPGEVAVDETMREAIVGDRWLLCSDGLSGVVSDETIGQVLADNATPAECCERLEELALLGGAPDNVTCVVADVVESASTPTQVPQVVGAAAKNRHDPTKGGGGAAARAAALSAPEPTPDEIDEDEADRPGRSRYVWTLVLVALLAALAGLLYGGWKWTQTQYYAQGSEGRVVVFQGIPQQLGSWHFSHPVEVTDLELDELAEVDKRRLEEPVMRPSRSEVDGYLKEVQQRADQSKPVRKGSVRRAHPNLAPQSGTGLGTQSEGSRADQRDLRQS